MPGDLSQLAEFASIVAVVTLFLGVLAYGMRRLFVARYKAGKKPRGLRRTHAVDQELFGFMRRRGQWAVATTWTAALASFLAPAGWPAWLRYAQLAAFLATPLWAMALALALADRQAGVTDDEVEAWLSGGPAR